MRLATRYRVAAEDPWIMEILKVIETGTALSFDQMEYAVDHARMVRRAIALAGLPIQVEKTGVRQLSFVPGRRPAVPLKVQAALATEKLDALISSSARRAAQPVKVSSSEETSAISALTQTAIDDFYASWEWARLRYRTLQKAGRTCMCCGATPGDGAKIHVDHIKPIRRFWHLRLDPNNLQVLCEPCNMGKGSWDETDFRPPAAPIDSKGMWPPSADDPPPWTN